MNGSLYSEASESGYLDMSAENQTINPFLKFSLGLKYIWQWYSALVPIFFVQHTQNCIETA